MRSHPVRRLALVFLACSVLVGCQSTTVGPTAPPDAGEPTSPVPPDDPAADEGIYRVALSEPSTTDNPWAIHDVEASAWNFIVQPPDPVLYTYDGPGHTFVPLLAAVADPPDPIPAGDRWSVTVPLRTDIWWSDGEPVDAHDLVFTFDTVRRLRMAGNYPHLWPVASEDDPVTEENEFNAGLVTVEALDDRTVRYVFNIEPGITMWPYSIGIAPLFPEHYWAPIAAEADEAADLYAVSGVGAPHAGGFVIEEWQSSAFWRNVAESDFWDRGARYVYYSNGSIEYTARSGYRGEYAGEPNGEVIADVVSGPFVSEVLYSIYTDKATAMLALEKGDVDYLWAPVGLERGLAETALNNPDLDVAINPQNGFRYLAFNMRRFPMSEREFRLSIACRIDKQFMAETVLGGATIALDTLVPPGYAYWFNEEAVAPCAGLTEQGRFEEAVRILADAGWTWEVEPRWDEGNRDVSPEGRGLRSPDGRLVEELELLAPGPGYDALRATYALFIEEWATEVGIPVRAEPTGFSIIVDKVFSPDADYDMYILGWGVEPVPSHVFDFFASDQDSTSGGFNTPGYSNPAFDVLADEWNRTRDLERARTLVKEAEAILAADQPYVVLFTTPVVEAFRRNVEYPFTEGMGGITWFLGFPTSVHLR